MTETIQVALIAAIPVTVLGIINVAITTLAHKRLSEIHLQINSRMDELLKQTAEHSRATGKAEGIESERDKIH